jgi:ribosomal protein L11 methylase PrmA
VNVYTSDEFQIRKDYNVVIANITVDVIIQYFKYFTEGQKNLKYVLLSGISDYRKSQLDIFLNTEGIVPSDVYADDGWYTYLLTYG